MTVSTDRQCRRIEAQIVRFRAMHLSALDAAHEGEAEFIGQELDRLLDEWTRLREVPSA